MHCFPALLLALPAIVVAQEQKPLGENVQAWFEKAKSYIPASVYSPVTAGAAKVAAENVTPLTKDNWLSVLSPSAEDSWKGPETWMVFFSGGNKTCYGRCDGVEKAWNESAALFAADPTAPHLAFVDCDEQRLFCTTWAASAPSIWHIQLPIPQADQSKPATTIRIIPLNATSTTAQEIVQIHTSKNYEKTPVYEGVFHPFDGYLVQFGLHRVLGYALYGFTLLPSWAFMIIISMLSRSFM